MSARAVTALLAAAMALPGMAWAEDFSAGSKASSWGLSGERLARFEAKVTDAVCALTGDCPSDCGAGLRQMVLIREADGVMVLAMKNTQPIFTGATIDMAPWCGQTVTVDGLIVGEAELTRGGRLMQVQTVTPAGGEAAKTNAWLNAWKAKNPDAADGEWFRKDPRIAERIAREGYLGLGLETDAAFIKENY